MKSFNLFIQFLFVFSSLLVCNAKKSNPFESYIKDIKDDKRDLVNYQNVENIERDIHFNGERALDVYYDKSNVDDLKPVYVFLYGGAWVSGSKVKFTKFGSLLQSNGYVTVIPNYVLFPHGNLEDMVDDVHKALIWTFENIKLYGGDPERISIAGYSAGSHLTTLTLLKTLFGIPNKNQYLRPLPTFEKIVLLNGPYDFDDYSTVLKLFGKSDNSIYQKLAKFLFKSKNVSPTDILRNMPFSSKTLGAKKFVFFYTSLDTEVKESSALNFISEMKRLCPTVDVQYVYKEGYEHTTLTRGVRAGEKEYEDVFMSLVEM